VLTNQEKLTMTNQKYTDRLNKPTTERLISKFKELCPSLGMSESMELVLPEISALRSGKCTLVVIGEIKKGKSSLINALLGLTNVLPVSSDVATATVFRVVYGPNRRNIVILRPKLEPSDALNFDEITEKEIAQEFGRMINQKSVLTEKEVTDADLFFYGTEDGNPGNEKGVDHIRIEVPCEALRNGLEIIDTPGLAGLMKGHADITWGYIPNAQAVLFVLESVQSPFTKDEQAFLSKIKTITPRIIFSQTKIDVVDPAKWNSWRERNLEEISKVLGIGKEEILYFPVSSEDKQIFIAEGEQADFESSGFGPLEDFIFNRLLKLYEQSLCLGVLGRIDSEMMEKEKEILVDLEIVQTDKGKLKDLEVLYVAKQKEFALFESEEFPGLIIKLQDELQDMIAEGEKALNNFLQPNLYNPVVDTFLGDIRSIGGSPGKIQKKIDELSSYFTDACAKRTTEIYTQYQQRIIEFVASEFEFLNMRLEELCGPKKRENGEDDLAESKIFSLTCIEKIGSMLPDIIKKQNDLRFHFFDNMKSFSLGASVGGTIGAVAGKATGVAIVSFFPPALPFALFIVGGMGILGSALGGIFNYNSTVHQQHQQIISHFQQALPGILLQLQKSFAAQYSDVMKKVRRKVRDEQLRITKIMKQRMIDRLHEIRELGNNEGESVKVRYKKLSDDLKQVQNLRTAIVQAAGNNSK
jgi:hypothetical protein